MGDALDVEQQRMADCIGQSRNTVYIVYRLKKKITKFLGCMVYAVGAKLVSNALSILATAECGHLKDQSSHSAEEEEEEEEKQLKPAYAGWLVIAGLRWT